MQWWCLVTYQLILIELLVRTVRAGGRIKRTVIGRYPLCPRGCTSCSHVNGCVTCEPQYFMFLLRKNMRQIGICTPSCPIGYYGVRHQYYSKCNRCHIEHCEACFSRHYCTRCAAPYLAFQGQCVESCPEGLYYANYSKDCRETVDCMVGPWSPWTVCSRNGHMCGYKYGVQTKSRQILEYPSPTGEGCPMLTESRRCRMVRRFCNANRISTPIGITTPAPQYNVDSTLCTNTSNR
ncbi:R-spondin-2-like isoform X2 [Gigantopelta aegis]|uniref:R-spondin-2-like isoform X2 n=1 Tax=Gigantopelta aegis TaxID=1735272 RepID=UPI001B88CAE1|nr:R-spondin-2-like isoform X2 [Gigantopelta aegis]